MPANSLPWSDSSGKRVAREAIGAEAYTNARYPAIIRGP